jgi:hypothetical protein
MEPARYGCQSCPVYPCCQTRDPVCRMSLFIHSLFPEHPVLVNSSKPNRPNSSSLWN